MSIPAELSTYESEDDFVKRFLLPLFVRMGYGIVANYHGKREFGKDLLIGEIDRFWHVRYHGVQAKYEASIGKEAMHGLILQAEEAFVKPFLHPQTGQQQKISSFYAVTAGSVSDEARELFFDSLQPKHADNVRIIEGKDLLALDRQAVISRTENVRELLSGLLQECRFNVTVLSQMAAILPAIAKSDGHAAMFMYPKSRLRVNALSSFLTKPFLNLDFLLGIAEQCWSDASAFNRVFDEIGVSPLHTVVSILKPAKTAIPMIAPLEKSIGTISAAVERALGELGPLAAL